MLLLTGRHKAVAALRYGEQQHPQRQHCNLLLVAEFPSGSTECDQKTPAAYCQPSGPSSCLTGCCFFEDLEYTKPPWPKDLNWQSSRMPMKLHIFLQQLSHQLEKWLLVPVAFWVCSDTSGTQQKAHQQFVQRIITIKQRDVVLAFFMYQVHAEDRWLELWSCWVYTILLKASHELHPCSQNKLLIFFQALKFVPRSKEINHNNGYGSMQSEGNRWCNALFSKQKQPLSPGK